MRLALSQSRSENDVCWRISLNLVWPESEVKTRETRVGGYIHIPVVGYIPPETYCMSAFFFIIAFSYSRGGFLTKPGGHSVLSQPMHDWHMSLIYTCRVLPNLALFRAGMLQWMQSNIVKHLRCKNSDRRSTSWVSWHCTNLWKAIKKKVGNIHFVVVITRILISKKSALLQECIRLLPSLSWSKCASPSYISLMISLNFWHVSQRDLPSAFDKISRKTKNAKDTVQIANPDWVVLIWGNFHCMPWIT